MKRDGREVPFNKNNIRNAIYKSFEDIAQTEPVKNADDYADAITNRLYSRYRKRKRAISVEEIQDDVENELMKEGLYAAAKAYIKYRYEHEVLRHNRRTDGAILSLVDNVNESVIQENSNKNPTIFSTQRDYIAGEVSKDITNRILLPEEIRRAHEEGIIHFHDADYFVQHMINCCLCNLEDMLQNGTVISGVMIEKPHNFSTACNIATQIVAQVASNQYGGQSISLAHLAPFVDVSRQKIRKQVEEGQRAAFQAVYGGTLTEFSESAEKAIRAITEKRLRDEVRKGIQTVQYQVVTLMTTNGQAPFITVFMYLGEVQDQQTKDDLAMIIEEVVNQRYEGVKNEKGGLGHPRFPEVDLRAGGGQYS